MSIITKCWSHKREVYQHQSLPATLENMRRLMYILEDGEVLLFSKWDVKLQQSSRHNVPNANLLLASFQVLKAFSIFTIWTHSRQEIHRTVFEITLLAYKLQCWITSCSEICLHLFHIHCKILHFQNDLLHSRYKIQIFIYPQFYNSNISYKLLRPSIVCDNK